MTLLASGDPDSSGGIPQSRPSSRWQTLRRLSRRQWLYLPRLFPRRERIFIVVLVLIAISSASALSARVVWRVTVPQPAVGGTLREGALQEPRFINPIYASSDTDRALAALVFSQLVRYNPAGEIEMDLAEDVVVASDGKAYTVNLRRGVQWHDGEDFTADDVLYTIRTIQDPGYQSPLRANWQGVTAEKLNDYTVRFSLRQPYAPFMENLAVGIVPAHLWERIPRDGAPLSDLNLKPVGTGPYQFDKFTRREDGVITLVALKRYKNHHRGSPFVKEIRFSFYPSEERMVAAYRRGEIDALPVATPDAIAALAELDAEIHEMNIPKVFGVFLNASTQPILGKRTLREALSHAIDRERIIRETTNGGQAIGSALPPGTIGFRDDLKPAAYDPDLARELIAQDGWKDADEDGVLERSETDANRRKVTRKLEVIITTADTPELAGAANLIAEMWRAVGVKTEVRALATANLEADVIRPRSYEILIFGEAFSHEPDPYAFWHTSQLKDPGLNIALYSNPTVDNLLAEARGLADRDARAERYRQFQKIVSDEIGAIFLYSPRTYYAIRQSTNGVQLTAVALPEDRFADIHRWYQDTRRALK
ncbi:peptide ABC transporter substrate-binding protein [Candidatus Parcubacteria bacterium]|nr:MAG: peptide ABC transporter substrate-binding protein [Candidatus Parcubacteria bacterium]